MKRTRAQWRAILVYAKLAVAGLVLAVVIFAGVYGEAFAVGFGSFLLGLWLPHDVSDLIRLRRGESP